MTEERLRFPHVDALRALAALAVLVFHASVYSGFSTGAGLGAVTARLDLGVTLFFLISGFLLYRPYVAARCGGRPALPLGEFYRRRILRIVPAYWVALVLLALWPGLGGGVLSLPDGLRFFLFAQNLSLSTVLQGIGPAWTLCVELSFYAVLPLYAALVARWLGGRAPGRQALPELGLLAALGVASLGLRALQHAVLDTGRGPVLAFLLPSFLLWFGLGMGLAVLSATGTAPGLQRAVGRHPGRCWLAGGALLAFAAWGMDLPQGFLGAYTDATWAGEHVVYGAIALCLIAPATLGVEGGGAVRRLLAWRPLALVGLISYGIYLYHLPLLIEFGFRGWPADVVPFAPTLGAVLLALAAAGGCATLSYRIVERPFLARKRRVVRPGPGGAGADRLRGADGAAPGAPAPAPATGPGPGAPVG